MKTQLNKKLICTTILGLAAAAGASALQLTDMVVFGADNSGNWYGQPDIWETRPGENYNVWISNGSSYLNGPSDAAAHPSIPLAVGVHTFLLYGSPGVDNQRFGISLFFDGGSTPSISAHGPMLTSSSQPHSFVADGAPNTPGLFPGSGYNTGYSFPGAGTLSFVSGNLLITLTDFYWATPSVFGADLVGQATTGADGELDYVGGITLTVAQVPEPSVAILGVGMLALLKVVRAHRKNQVRKLR